MDELFRTSTASGDSSTLTRGYVQYERADGSNVYPPLEPLIINEGPSCSDPRVKKMRDHLLQKWIKEKEEELAAEYETDSVIQRSDGQA